MSDYQTAQEIADAIEYEHWIVGAKTTAMLTEIQTILDDVIQRNGLWPDELPTMATIEAINKLLNGVHA